MGLLSWIPSRTSSYGVSQQEFRGEIFFLSHIKSTRGWVCLICINS